MQITLTYLRDWLSFVVQLGARYLCDMPEGEREPE
jgi:hypothetical protein